VPEISRFYGIVIKMFYADHSPPHFHAEYGGHGAVIDIETLAIISGQLPPRAINLIKEWGSLHRSDLIRDWQKAEQLNPLDQIAPLP